MYFKADNAANPYDIALIITKINYEMQFMSCKFY